MLFGYSQGKEEITICFYDCEEAISYLIDGGYLDDEWRDNSDEDSVEYCQAVADAVIDKLMDTAESLEDKIEELKEESNDVLRAAIVMDLNLYFNQFVEYRNGVKW